MDTPEWSRSVRWCEWKELKDDSPLLQLLRYIVIESDELSGRMLRKLPFTAYSCVNMDGKKMLSLRSFLDALADSIRVRIEMHTVIHRRRRGIAEILFKRTRLHSGD